MKRVVVSSAHLVAFLVLVSLIGCVPINFLAGQNENIGTIVLVTLENQLDDYIVFVLLDLNDPWVLGDPPVTHAAIGTELDTDTNGVNWVKGIPQNKAGNPKVGQFPYELLPVGDNIYALWPPVSGFKTGDWVYVAVHAEVYNLDDQVWDPDLGENVPRKESAWAAGSQFNEGKSWAMFTPYQVELPVVPPDLP